jgi:hypothetical protein
MVVIWVCYERLPLSFAARPESASTTGPRPSTQSISPGHETDAGVLSTNRPHLPSRCCVCPP